jgi:hypothetical protein
MSLDLTGLDTSSANSSGGTFRTTVKDAVAKIDDKPSPPSSRVLLVSRASEENTTTTTISTSRIAPDGGTPEAIEPVIIETATDNTPTAGTTAVILTQDSSGQTNDATVINIIDNVEGGGSTISIQVMDKNQPTGISTVIFNTQMLTSDTTTVYGNIAKDARKRMEPTRMCFFSHP